MNNVSSDSPTISRLRSGRTYWVRSNLAAPTKDNVNAHRSPDKQVSKKRFVEPVRLSDSQRGEILDLLEKRGIGDAESRNLFVSAMEYDLAGCDIGNRPSGPAVADSGTPSATDGMLAGLGTAAERLMQRLAALDEAEVKRLLQHLSAADHFKRSYGEPYLTALQIELNRIVTVTAPTKQAVNAATTTTPALSDAARRFVQRTADAFRDCFEEEPTIERGSPFMTAFEAVVVVSGVKVPIDPTTIREILA